MQDIFRIVKLIKDRSLDPVIVFSFSRRECEQAGPGAVVSREGDGEPRATRPSSCRFSMRWR